jgi:hypothetical protein
MKKVIGMCLLAAACTAGDDGPENPDSTAQTFTLRIDNIAPWRVLKSGTVGNAALGPGEMYSITFTAGKGQAVSFATMLGESNDWFFGPGPEGLMLYDERGAPISGDVTRYIKLWDAGTEFDQEPAVGSTTGPRQPAPNTGPVDPEAGVRELRSPVALNTGASFALPPLTSMIKVMLTPSGERTFTLTIQNCSSASTLVTSQGAMPIHLSPMAWALHVMPAAIFSADAPASTGLERIAEDGNPEVAGAELAAVTGFHTPIAPGVFVVHRDPAPLFAAGERDRGQGLEALAEDGNPSMLAAIATGAFDTPVGATEPGPAMPGMAYEVSFTAQPGDRLSFATMFGMSNDWFFATAPDGVPLTDGDVQVGLYNAGTEIDQELAIGTFTAPQQPAPNTGPLDASSTVRMVTASEYARSANDHLRVTLITVAD